MAPINGHIMISYEWDSQTKVKEIHEALKGHQFNIWIDVENMSGDIYKKMAEGVEGAEIIIVCMSSKYQQSKNCNIELKYAQDKGKNIIPIKIEDGYSPSGSLGLITAGKVYVDFSNWSKFDENIKSLKKEIESYLSPTVAVNQNISSVVPSPVAVNQNISSVVASSGNASKVSQEGLPDLIGRVWRFESFNFPGFYIRHQNFMVRIDRFEHSDLYNLDSSWRVVRGLCGSGISFQSKNYPDHYLRHCNYQARIDRVENTDLFRKDASFIPQSGLANINQYSFESVNYRGYFLRHCNYFLRIDIFDRSDLFNMDATFHPIDLGC